MARAGRKRGSVEGAAAARAAIVEAAAATLSEHGFSATSARAVAQRAGVAAGGVFYHFGSMDDLLAAVFTELLDRRVARLGGVLAAPRPELAAALSRAVTDEFAHPESRALLELVVGAVTSPPLAREVLVGMARSTDFARQVVDRLLEGSPLAAVLPLDLVAQIAASAFFGLAAVDLVGAPVDIEGLAALVGALANLTAPAPATAPAPPIAPAG